MTIREQLREAGPIPAKAQLACEQMLELCNGDKSFFNDYKMTVAIINAYSYGYIRGRKAGKRQAAKKRKAAQ